MVAVLVVTPALQEADFKRGHTELVTSATNCENENLPKWKLALNKLCE